ncbi:MAG: sulfite exporter TauE/SafE family protein [Pseudanabaenaceae cyanobacterium SKYGB_i_bin29]|nr:sulfite exporter TauE/SafE family protein [Pseudanabaenaceae cyanobacterium SKYG29]MDW8420395.1 sulfite exporter TauE/SafE family protein [Pseudanabaenaceae cyanobacterium SKYGB_i_bin29]
MMGQIGGYFLASLIGISLGLIGGGGSILTVPVLVYVMGVNATRATAYSLFIVGITALVGSLDYCRKRLISWQAAVVFSLPAFSSVFVVRKYLIPAIPREVLRVGSFILTKDIFLMVVFALLMIFASVSMIRDRKNGKEEEVLSLNSPLIGVTGLLVGGVTGLVGAGGGFMIIPALVNFAHLPMKKAVGTSLLIIATNSLIGFIGDLMSPTETIDWNLLISFSFIACLGIFFGSYLSNFIPGARLKKGFGWFVAVMALYILAKEIAG